MSQAERKEAAKKVRVAVNQFNKAIKECLDLEMQIAFISFESNGWGCYREANEDEDTYSDWIDIDKITYQPPTPPVKTY